MEVILLERIEALGQMGDTVKVKPGYARNYLLPQRKALRANAQNRAHFEERRAALEADNLQKRQEAEAVAARMSALKPVIIRQAGDNGQLYGSVTARDIADTLGEIGVRVDRKQILLNRSIKLLGLYPARIALHAEVIVEVMLNIARSEEEAVLQEKAATGGESPMPGAADPTTPDQGARSRDETPTDDHSPDAPGETTQEQNPDQPHLSQADSADTPPPDSPDSPDSAVPPAAD